MNPFQQIPAAVRRWLYLAWALLVLADGAAAAGYGAAHTDVPTWVIVAGAVLLYVGAPLGFTAASNVNDGQTVSVSAPEAATVKASVSLSGMDAAKGQIDGLQDRPRRQ